MEDADHSSAIQCNFNLSGDRFYVKLLAGLLSLAVCCTNFIFLISNIKCNRNISPLGLMMTSAFFINSSVTWLQRLLLLLVKEIFSAVDADLCTVFGAIYLVSLHFQAILLAAIAHDRAQMISKPLNWHELFIQRRPLLMFFACLVPPLAVTVPTLTTTKAFCADVVLGCITNPLFFASYTIPVVAVTGAVQWSCVIWYITSYVIIWRAARIATQPSHMVPSSGRRAALRTFAVLGLQHFLFMILPNMFAALAYSSMPEDVRIGMFVGLVVLFSGNEIVSPVVYVSFDKSSRDALRKLLIRKRRDLTS